MMNQLAGNKTLDRYWDWMAALLFVVAMITAATRLVVTKWVEDLSLVQTVVFLGALAGLALGKSIFSRRSVIIFAFVYGLYTIPWQLGLTMGRGVEWKERVLSMFGRLSVIIHELVYQEPITDNLFFLFSMSLLFWALSIYGGYHLVRYAAAWRAILPAGLAIFVIQNFDPLLSRRAWYLSIYIFLALLIVGRLVFLKQREKWLQHRTYIPRDVGFDLSRVTLTISTVLILFVWNAPIFTNPVPGLRAAYQVIRSPILTLTDKMSYMFASLQASVGVVTEYYSDEHLLGRGSIHTDSLVMTIEAPRTPYIGARYYWRARVYDEYRDGRWLTNVKETEPYTPESVDFPSIDSKGRVRIQVKITPYEALSTLYTPAQPLWISRPGRVQLAKNPTGTVDVVALQANPVLRPGEVYEVRSSLSSVTQYQLRQSGRAYPDWVKERYLALPDNITPRTRQLAAQIAAPYDNTYDIVQAITNWLRENITYNEVIDPPPSQQETIDWFLFDYRQGFCNYYATAEVIMLRSLGIPARWAVGYAQGERTISPDEEVSPQKEEMLAETLELEVSTFTVRQKDAHAWPEVYFPGIGWVEFEPTSGQTVLMRPLGEARSSPDDDQDDEEKDRLDASNIPHQEEPFDPHQFDSYPQPSGFGREQRLGLVVSGIMIVLALGLGALAYFSWRSPDRVQVIWVKIITGDYTPIPTQIERGLQRLGIRPPDALSRWSYYSSLPIISKAYHEINRALRLLKSEQLPNATPAERTSMLVTILPQAEAPAERLLDIYQMAAYSPHPTDEVAANQAGKEIHHLSLVKWLQKFFSRFQEPEKKRSTF